MNMLQQQQQQQQPQPQQPQQPQQQPMQPMQPMTPPPREDKRKVFIDLLRAGVPTRRRRAPVRRQGYVLGGEVMGLGNLGNLGYESPEIEMANIRPITPTAANIPSGNMFLHGTTNPAEKQTGGVGGNLIQGGELIDGRGDSSVGGIRGLGGLGYDYYDYGGIDESKKEDWERSAPPRTEEIQTFIGEAGAAGKKAIGEALPSWDTVKEFLGVDVVPNLKKSEFQSVADIEDGGGNYGAADPLRPGEIYDIPAEQYNPANTSLQHDIDTDLDYDVIGEGTPLPPSIYDIPAEQYNPANTSLQHDIDTDLDYDVIGEGTPNYEYNPQFNLGNVNYGGIAGKVGLGSILGLAAGAELEDVAESAGTQAAAEIAAQAMFNGTAYSGIAGPIASLATDFIDGGFGKGSAANFGVSVAGSVISSAAINAGLSTLAATGVGAIPAALLLAHSLITRKTISTTSPAHQNYRDAQYIMRDNPHIKVSPEVMDRFWKAGQNTQEEGDRHAAAYAVMDDIEQQKKSQVELATAAYEAALAKMPSQASRDYQRKLYEDPESGSGPHLFPEEIELARLKRAISAAGYDRGSGFMSPEAEREYWLSSSVDSEDEGDFDDEDESETAGGDDEVF